MRKSFSVTTNPRYPTFWEHIWIFSTKTPRIPQEVWLDPSWLPGGLLDPFAAATSGRMGFFRGGSLNQLAWQRSGCKPLEYSVYKSTNDIKHIFIYIWIYIYIHIMPGHIMWGRDCDKWSSDFSVDVFGYTWRVFFCAIKWSWHMLWWKHGIAAIQLREKGHQMSTGGFNQTEKHYSTQTGNLLQLESLADLQQWKVSTSSSVSTQFLFNC